MSFLKRLREIPNGLRELPSRLQDIVDGLTLLCLGVLLATLAQSPQYWYFLNPRFSTLTLASGVLLGLVGLVPLLRPRPGRATITRLVRQAAVLGFLCLAAYAWEQAATAPFPGVFSAPDKPQALFPPPGAPAPAAAPLVTKHGAEYTRLTLAELYIMLDKGRTDYPRRFAMRVQLSEEPALKKLGLGVLTRTAVVCCLADSMQLGFLAQGLERFDTKRSDTNGWLEIYGRLEPMDPAGEQALKAVAQGEGMSLKVVNPKFRVVVEAAEPIGPPPFPYLFEFREQPPFAW